MFMIQGPTPWWWPFVKSSKMTHPSDHVEALVKLSEFQIGYIAWSSSAMTPSAIVYILNEITFNRRKRILELGMGVSTFFIAALARSFEDVCVLSVDHDLDWIHTCRQDLSLKSLLLPSHKIVHAPIRTMSYNKRENIEYYDTDILEEAMCSFGNIDLVIVDGPPAWHRDISRSRLPASNVLDMHLSDDATIFIDDYQRPGEAALVESFIGKNGWRVTLKDPHANVCVLKNSNADYNIF